MDSNRRQSVLEKLFFYFLFCFIGSFATIYCVVLDMNSIVASSLVSIIAAFFTIIIKDENHYSWATFCGSFAGMTSFEILTMNSGASNWSLDFLLYTVTLSTITSVMYMLSEILSHKFPKLSFDGYGGRLGTIAFISVLIYFFIGKLLKLNAGIEIFSSAKPTSLSDLWFLLTIVSAIAASLISMEIKNTVSSLNDNYKVFTVATTGIIGGLIITKIPIYGYDYGLAWYTGAFIGMSSYYVLMFKRQFFLSGLISGVFFILTKNVFIGVGGKLGFISFLSIVFLKISSAFYNKILHFRKKDPESIIESLKTGDISNQPVNDDYAQKLVESIKLAQESGEDIAKIENSESGKFVIGEKIDLEEYKQFTIDHIVNYEFMPENIKEIADFLNDINLKNWAFLQKIDVLFSPMSYQGIDDSRIDKIKFKESGNFISILKKERRVIAFSEKGLKQNIFSERFSEKDISDTKLLIIFPVFAKIELSGVFIIFDKSDNIKNSKNNLKLIKSYFVNISQTLLY
ncbi:MAG: hypothetical protein BWX91_00513 [Spirochaetes bacterium ADurb.Bin133]|nr:MAG: hypothetical protein BWX91_00513 [Spirochaetes bacterium ADurb.Bin133]